MHDLTPLAPARTPFVPFPIADVHEFAPRCTRCGERVAADPVLDPTNPNRVVHRACLGTSNHRKAR